MAEDDNPHIFIYTGVEEVPQDVQHVLIQSTLTIPDRAFFGRRLLQTVQCSQQVIEIGRNSFTHCHSLRWIALPGVIDIDILAFANCANLEDVEFGDKLEMIREKMPFGGVLPYDILDCHHLLGRFDHMPL